jgi:hypothetical protein
MIQKHPHRVVITTRQGQIVVARRLYDRFEARMEPGDLGQLADYTWWQHASEVVQGIYIISSSPQRRTHA